MATNQRTSPARIVGTILGIAGLVLLVIAEISNDGGFHSRPNSTGEGLGSVISVLTFAAFFAGLAGMIGRQRFLAIVNTMFAIAIGLLTAWRALSDDRPPGPNFPIMLFACALLAISALASTLPDTMPGARETIDQGDGRKLVYENDKVVAIEQWGDGKLVSTKPFGTK